MGSGKGIRRVPLHEQTTAGAAAIPGGGRGWVVTAHIWTHGKAKGRLDQLDEVCLVLVEDPFCGCPARGAGRDHELDALHNGNPKVFLADCALESLQASLERVNVVKHLVAAQTLAHEVTNVANHRADIIKAFLALQPSVAMQTRLKMVPRIELASVLALNISETPAFETALPVAAPPPCPPLQIGIAGPLRLD
eukprot:7328736-Alexandrium_andersonii.AAC.1